MHFGARVWCGWRHTKLRQFGSREDRQNGCRKYKMRILRGETLWGCREIASPSSLAKENLNCISDAMSLISEMAPISF